MPVLLKGHVMRPFLTLPLPLNYKGFVTFTVIPFAFVINKFTNQFEQLSYLTVLYSLRATTLTFSCSLQKASISPLSKEARINTLVLDFKNSSISITL